MAEETKTNKQAAVAKARAAKVANKEVVNTKVVEPEIKISAEPTEKDIVEAELKAKEAKRVAAEVITPVEVKAEAVAPVQVSKPVALELPGGKWIAKIGNRILRKANKEKIEHFISQF